MLVVIVFLVLVEIIHSISDECGIKFEFTLCKVSGISLLKRGNWKTFSVLK